MNNLPLWMQDLASPLVNETSGEHLARCLKAFENCSLLNNADKLASLFLINEKDLANAKRVSTIQTSCATSFRAFLCLAGCKHPLATSPYNIGEAISDVIKIASDLGALVSLKENPDAWKLLSEGWGIYYAVGNNNHVEMCLSKVDPQTGIATTGGGGRANNLISIGSSDVRKSWGRPIVYIMNPNLMVSAGPTPALIPPPFAAHTLIASDLTEPSSVGSAGVAGASEQASGSGLVVGGKTLGGFAFLAGAATLIGNILNSCK